MLILTRISCWNITTPPKRTGMHLGTRDAKFRPGDPAGLKLKAHRASCGTRTEELCRALQGSGEAITVYWLPAFARWLKDAVWTRCRTTKFVVWARPWLGEMFASLVLATYACVSSNFPNIRSAGSSWWVHFPLLGIVLLLVLPVKFHIRISQKIPFIGIGCFPD